MPTLRRLPSVLAMVDMVAAGQLADVESVVVCERYRDGWMLKDDGGSRLYLGLARQIQLAPNYGACRIHTSIELAVTKYIESWSFTFSLSLSFFSSFLLPSFG
jgi:hypothetical protein